MEIFHLNFVEIFFIGVVNNALNKFSHNLNKFITLFSTEKIEKMLNVIFLWNNPIIF